MIVASKVRIAPEYIQYLSVPSHRADSFIQAAHQLSLIVLSDGVH